MLARVGGLASGVCYYAGFAPPTALRRAWQEPELRTFLRHAARLPRLPDTPAVLAELRAGVGRSLGAPGAAIGLWDATAGVLRFAANGRDIEIAPGRGIAGLTFAQQRVLFFEDSIRADPENAGDEE